MARRADSLPFLVVPTDPLDEGDPIVDAGQWASAEGDLYQDRAAVEGWDYSTPLELTRTVHFSGERLRAACGLGNGAEVSISAEWEWKAPGTLAYLRGVSGEIFHETLEEGQERRVTVKLVIPGDKAGATLLLTTRVSLHKAGATPGPVAASLPGSSLWSDEVRIVLEGEAARMPVALVDFEKLSGAGLHQSANWRVDIQGDALELPVSQGIHVLLNSTRDEVKRALVGKPEPGDQFGEAVRSTLKFDVGRQLIEFALRDDDFVQRNGQGYDEGTLGWAAAANLRLLFRGEGVSQVRDMAESNPGHFQAAIQSWFELFDSGSS